MEKIDFKGTREYMRKNGFISVNDPVKIVVPDAKNELYRGIKYFVKEAQWLPEYDDVSKWLSGNNGRGLLCHGNCGRGKSLICCKVIPLLLFHYCKKVVSCYDAQQINSNIDDVKKQHIIYIDDVGTEDVSVKYGERRMAFPELVDEAEKRNKLLIITTNLSLDEISQKYGERTIDRLVAITTRVKFVGRSLRK